MAASCDIIPKIKDANGKLVESKLFTDLLAHGLKRVEVKSLYRQIFSEAFKNENGDWENSPSKYKGTLDANGEPSMTDVLSSSISSSITSAKKAREEHIPVTAADIEKHTEEEGYALDKPAGVYRDKNGTVELDRLTEKTSEMFSQKNKGEERMKPEEVAARKIYNENKTDYADPITIQGETYTYDELVEHKRKEQNTNWRNRGNIVHAIIENFIRPSKKVQDRLAELYAGEPGESYGIDKSEYTWVEKKIKSIFRDLEINTYEDGVNPEERDKLSPEIVIASKLLQIGTTIDNLVEHIGGALSIIDWKTGNLTDDLQTSQFMKYGNSQTEDIKDCKLHKAKLEIVYRALIIKESMPGKNIRFRNLVVAHISRDGKTEVHKIDVQAYLGLIESYYKDAANGKLDVYKELKERGLLDHTQYMADNRELEDKEIRNLENKERLDYLLTKQRILRNSIKKLADKSGEWRMQQDLNRLTEDILKVKSELGITPNDDVADMGFFKRWVTNMYGVSNPRLKAFFKLLIESKKSARDRIQNIFEEYSVLHNAVQEEYFAQHGGKSALNKATRGGINGLKYNELYKFMWEEKNSAGRQGKYFRVITQAQVAAGDFTQVQYEYNKFVRETMAKEYKKVASKTAYIENNRFEKTVADAMGSPAELPEDFAPRYMMAFEEAVERDGFTGKNTRDYFMDSLISDFTENQYRPIDKQMGVPFKYMGSDSIIQSENYTMSAELAFKNFITNVIMKDELDDVYSVGQGTIELLKDKTDNTGNPFKNTIDFLEDQIYLHVLDIKKPTKWSRKNVITFKYKGKDHSVSVDKIMKMLKSWVSYSSMWLKLIPGTFNASLIFIMNAKEAVKGSISKRTHGIDAKDIDFSMSDLIKAQADYGDFLWKSIIGKKEESKLWILAKKFDYLPDNYDYAIRKGELLGVKNKLIDTANLYLFHSIGEEYGNLALMSAQLRHYQMGSKSAWDSYDDKGNYIGDRSMITSEEKELTELDALEINKFKRVSSRIHGAYRQDERTALELSALGQWALQFKKYLPNVLENLGQTKYEDMSIGSYELRKNQKGEDVYTWIGRINEGRARVLASWLLNVTKLRANPEYNWSTMPAEQKQQLYDLMITGSLYSAMLVANSLIWGDDDDDDPWARRMRRLADDTTQGVAFWDILSSMQTQTTVLPRLYKTSVAAQDILFDGLLMGKRTRTGDIPGFEVFNNALPIFTSLEDLEKYIEINDTGRTK